MGASAALLRPVRHHRLFHINIVINEYANNLFDECVHIVLRGVETHAAENIADIIHIDTTIQLLVEWSERFGYYLRSFICERATNYSMQSN